MNVDRLLTDYDNNRLTHNNRHDRIPQWENILQKRCKKLYNMDTHTKPNKYDKYNERVCI